MKEYYPPLFVTVAVSSDTQLRAVYAVLAGASVAAIATGNGTSAASAKPVTALASEPSVTQESPTPAGTGPSATTDASLSDVEVDAHGWPWSPELHASTKGVTKDGLWRMKVGVSRPDPKPGFPVAETTGTATSGTASEPTPSATSTTATEAAPAPSDTEDDEFAAFRAAAAKADNEEAAAKASVPARKWTDADLGAICNQAAVKLGDPTPVKEIIAKFVPAGEVAHSRNIPEATREDFAKAVEAKAGIEFAG